MRSTVLPNSDLRVSVVGLGCNAFGTRADREASLAMLDRALDAGITLFDTAECTATASRKKSWASGCQERRERVVLTTKGGGAGNKPAERGGSRKHLRGALEASLRRLQTDYIDLYYVHYYDGITPDDETFETLETFKREGKIRAVGSFQLLRVASLPYALGKRTQRLRAMLRRTSQLFAHRSHRRARDVAALSCRETWILRLLAARRRKSDGKVSQRMHRLRLHRAF